MRHNRFITRYEAILREHGARNTAQKRQIFRYLLKTDANVSAARIAEKNPNINKSTVYRILESFTAQRIVKIVPRGFKVLYELGEDFNQHHHHITCEKCGRSVALHSDEMEKMIKNISLNVGMRPTRHYIELYGICWTCQRKLRKNPENAVK
jgi:Fur family ferric uptake transcriptional regulator